MAKLSTVPGPLVIRAGWVIPVDSTFRLIPGGEVVIDAAIEAPDAVHAHDAEAQARWEKAHNKDTAGPASDAHDRHDDHHHADPALAAPAK